MQKRLAALTHLDAPWRPRDIEQREGRILRQGNTYVKVRIFRHVTTGSFDAYMWQLLEVKARFIAQVMCGEVSTRRVEDLDNAALTFAEIKAIASGNPLVMDKVRVDTEICKLDALRASHQNQLYRLRREMTELPSMIERSQRMTAEVTMTVGGREFSGKGAREQAAQALTAVILSWKTDESLQVRAHYRGFEILSQVNRPSFLNEPAPPSLFVRGNGTYDANLNFENPLGTVQSIDHALRSLDRFAEREHERLQQLEAKYAAFRRELEEPFEHELRLRELLVKQANLNAALDLNKSDFQTAAIGAEPEESAGG